MDVGILEPKEVPDFGTEFVFSAFLPDADGVQDIRDHLASGTDVSSPAFSYSHIRDYEGNLLNPVNNNDFAIYFLNERSGTQRRGAYYLNITAKSNLKRRRTTKSSYVAEDKIDGIELTLRGQTAEEIEGYEGAKKEFEEGGPKTEDIVDTPEGDDGLSDTDAIGEVDPMYSR
jgi:Paf1